MRYYLRNFIKIVVVALFVFIIFRLGAPSKAATLVDLGLANSFAVLAGSGITNSTGPTTITGDVGSFPTATETGFGSVTLNGTNHFGDVITQGAKTDLATAFSVITGKPCEVNLDGQDLGGLTLNPAVYCFSTSAQLTGILTLNAQNDPNAVFIFKIGSTLTTASSSSIVFINGTQASNVFWQVGTSATLGTGTDFKGNILASASITDTGGSTVNGRLLAINALVTISNTAIIVPTNLTLNKIVVNDNGGSALATAWLLAAAGPTPISGVTGSVNVTNAQVDSGTYTLSESGGPAGYSASTYSCVTNGGGAVVSNSITLSPGDRAICTITNNDQSAHLIVIKHVVNDNAGTNLALDFTTIINGVTTATPTAVGAEAPGVDNTLTSIGAYSVDEGAHLNYTKTLSIDCSGIISLGETKTCTITNDDILAADITPPAAITNLALSGATTSSIVLTWTAPGDDTNTGTATLYDIRYATSPIVTAGDFTASSLVSGEPAPAVAGTVQNMTVTGLSANTLYYFAMKTSDEVPNISTVSNIPSLSTAVAPDIIPPAAISNLALSGATTSSIVLTWTAPGDDTNTGTATLYDIRYATSPIVTAGDFTAASLVSGEPAPAVAGTLQNMTVSGLSANTLYYFAMKTSDEVPNISTVSNIPSLSTAVAPDIIPPAAISNLALSGATTSSIVLTWTAPGDDTNTGTATLYDIRYSTSPIVTAGDFTAASLVSGEPAPAVAGTVQNMTVTGLSAGRLYYFAIKTSDEAPNISAVSNIASLATISNISGGSVPDTTPPINSNISAASITQSSVIITWQTDEMSNSLVRFGPTSAIGGTAFDEVLGTKHLVPITGLTIDTIYHYTVCSYDSSGNQSCSGEFIFKTLSANAPLPTYSSAEELASSLTINIDKSLSVSLSGTSPCVSGTLIKLPSDDNPLTQVDSTVYYCGADGNRYVFPNLETYLSWYPDFSNIVIVSLDNLASIPIVGNVTYRPGRFLAKVQSDFKVYAIAKGGVLRWITSEAVAQSLYGLLWKNLINDIPATFFVNYILGEPITPADVEPAIPANL
jgi:hypothetical protein